MAFTQHGNAAYLFGFQDAGVAAIATSIGLAPQTLSVTYEAEFTAEAQNEIGEIVAMVVGQDKASFTMTGYVIDEGALMATTDFTFGGKNYIVTGRKVDSSNTEFIKGELSGVSYIGVTEAP